MEASNPYQAPLAALEKTSGVHEYDTTSVFSLKGRFGRLSFLAWLSVLYLAQSAIVVSLFFIAERYSGDSASLWTGVMPVFWVVVAGTTVLGIIFGIRRAHDFNASGWTLLLLLIPVVNIIYLLVLALMPGVEGVKSYGPPRATQTWEKIVGVVLPGLLAALLLVGFLISLTGRAFVE